MLQYKYSRDDYYRLTNAPCLDVALALGMEINEKECDQKAWKIKGEQGLCIYRDGNNWYRFSDGKHGFPVCLSSGMLDELQRFASGRNITVAQAIRYLLERGLSLTMFTEEQETIRRFIREEIQTVMPIVMKQYMDRLIAMQAVSARTSAAALQCNVAVLAENYTDSATPEEILANALRQSCRITKTRPKSDDEYLREAHEWLNSDLGAPNDK